MGSLVVPKPNCNLLPWVESGVESPWPTVGEAYWNQRHELAKRRELLLKLTRAVDAPGSLSPQQWSQMLAVGLEFQPDLILEMGRHYGNSTCVFTEVANALGPDKCRGVISLCLMDVFQKDTLPKLQGIVDEAWFKPLTTLVQDILTYDFEKALKGAKRVLVLWDAHGYEVAGAVLGKLMPLLADREHLVLMHDISDARYLPEADSYGDCEIWKEIDFDGPRIRLGHVSTKVSQGVSILDFCTRNRMPLNSVDHSLQLAIASDPARVEEMRRLLGDELFSFDSQWAWFSLNEAPGPYQFPRFVPPPPPVEPKFVAAPLFRRIKTAAKVLLNRYSVEQLPRW